MSAFTLDVSGKIPDCQARWPLNSTSDAPMMHLSSSRCTCPDAAALVANVHRAQLSSAPPPKPECHLEYLHSRRSRSLFCKQLSETLTIQSLIQTADAQTEKLLRVSQMQSAGALPYLIAVVDSPILGQFSRTPSLHLLSWSALPLW